MPDAADLKGIDFGEVLKASPDGVLIVDQGGRIAFINEQVKRLFGYPLEDMLGHTIEILIPERLRGLHEEHRRDYSKAPKARPMGIGRELLGRRKDGSEFFIEISLSPLKSPNGVFIICMIRDATERRRGETLRKTQFAISGLLSEAKSEAGVLAKILHIVCESLDWTVGAAWSLDPQTNILRYAAHWPAQDKDFKSFLEASQRLSFAPGQGLVGRAWADRKAGWIKDASEDPGFNRRQEAKETGLRGALAFPIFSGGKVLGVLEFFSVKTGSPNPEDLAMLESLGTSIAQFMELKRTERSLAAGEALLSRAEAIAHLGSYEIDLFDHAKSRWSAEMYRILEKDPEQAPLTIDECMGHCVHPDDRAAVERRIEDTVKSRSPLDSEYRIRAADGSIKHVRIIARPRVEAQGRVTHLDGTMQDVTKEREIAQALRNAELGLLQAQKMEAVGRLAGGVAHEINNPLTTILGFAQSLLINTGKDDPSMMPLKSIEREALRCKELVKDLLAFSRKEKEVKRPCDLNQLVSACVDIIAGQAKIKSISVIKELSERLPLIPMKPERIQQVVINLANNAMDAMEAGGTLTIKTLRNGNQMEMHVQDTGPGIPKDIQSRIFEPFFTTKESGKGTGLGLALVYEIIRDHGGRIELQSEPGKGALFKILLPISGSDVVK